jgi:hypothetical protein
MLQNNTAKAEQIPPMPHAKTKDQAHDNLKTWWTYFTRYGTVMGISSKFPVDNKVY